MCVCVCVCVYVCVMQNVSKNKNLISLEHVAAAHQKTTESKIQTRSKCSKNGTFCYVNVVKDIYVL